MYGQYEDDLSSRLTPDATKLPGRIESYLKFAMLDIPESMGRPLNAYIRESSILLTVNNCVKTAQDFLSVILLVIITVILVGYSLCLLFPQVFVDTTTQFLTAFVARYIGQKGAVISFLQSFESRNTKLFAATLGACIACAKAPDIFGYWRAEIQVKIALHKKMVRVAKCVRAMVKCYDLISRHSDLPGKLEHFENLKTLMLCEEAKVQKMLVAIASPSLDAPSSFGLHVGPAIVAWNLLLDKDFRQLVLAAIVAMGEIDAVLTLTQTVLRASPQHPFSLPVIVNSTEAILEVHSAHFPPVSALSSNTAHADTYLSVPPISILTAENGAGKTTFALAWMNILLSTQSFGIAACAVGTQVSVFDSIMTSMGVSDSNQESSHESHERYDQELVAAVTHHPEKKVFVLLDELYWGTHEEKGAAKLKALAHKLGGGVRARQLKIVFISHFRTFAQDETIDAVRYTTRKDWQQKPSGVLEEGVYDFQRGKSE
jgi:hypothetical protein